MRIVAPHDTAQYHAVKPLIKYLVEHLIKLSNRGRPLSAAAAFFDIGRIMPRALLLMSSLSNYLNSWRGVCRYTSAYPVGGKGVILC